MVSLNVSSGSCRSESAFSSDVKPALAIQMQTGSYFFYKIKTRITGKWTGFTLLIKTIFYGFNLLLVDKII